MHLRELGVTIFPNNNCYTFEYWAMFGCGETGDLNILVMLLPTTGML